MGVRFRRTIRILPGVRINLAGPMAWESGFELPPFVPELWLDPGMYAAILVPELYPLPTEFSGSVNEDIHTAYTLDDDEVRRGGIYRDGDLITFGGLPGDDATRATGWTDSRYGGFYLYDAYFKAELYVTPEPVSLALLATGLAGVGVVRRRRRDR